MPSEILVVFAARSRRKLGSVKVTVSLGMTFCEARYAGSRGSSRRTGRISMALIVKARRLIRQPASVSS